MAVKVILVGTAGWGRSWCTQTLPKAIREGLVEPVGAVDVNPDNLKNAQEHLGLSEQKCFLDMKTAFAKVAADACIIASPPDTHEEAALLALESGCDVLSEKPISDSVESSLRILEKVRSTGKKMGITMTHRFRQHIWTLRDLMQSGAYGKLDYIVFNFNWNRRDGLKPRQASMENTMFIEGAVHHLDLLENLAGSKCTSIYADAWNPKWGNFTGSSQALLTLKFENGVRAGYETAWSNASAQNSWANDYLLQEFVNWVSGGREMETNIESNFRSLLLVFAAIESSNAGLPIDIHTFSRSFGL
ncbi:MAG: gfo/Idh/MocA family oxidoreductase [Bacilli bacterium]|nr:gfo/Idh/MocA family oxidoreductase [Bacilli bacterium]